MKKLLLILIMVCLSSNLYPSWIKTGDYDFIKTGNKITSIAITGDSKFFYTSDDSGRVIKYDLATGDSLAMIKSIVPAGYATSTGWCVISKDARTFNCYHYDEIPDAFANYLYIYDIETGKPVDSTSYNWGVSRTFYPEFTLNLVFADYDYVNKTIFWGTSTNSVSNYAYHQQIYTGTILYSKKDSDKWRNYISVASKPTRCFYYDPKYFYFIGTNSGSSRVTIPSDIYNSHESKKAFLYDKAKDSVKTHYYYATENYKITEGSLFWINSFFVENGIIYLQNANNLTKINAQNLSQISVTKIDPYNPDNTGYLAQSAESEHFFVINGNKLSVHDDITAIRKNVISIDSVDNLVRYRNTPDGASLLLTDENGDIVKLDYKNIFKLRANFKAGSTVVTDKDIVRFTNLSLGNPTDYLWDFGDGSTSNDINPTHLYSDTGRFTVTLIVKNSVYSDTLIKPDYIHVIRNPNVNFDYEIKPGYPVRCVFNNTTPGAYDSLKWEFHDGSVSSNNTTEHIYYINGLYDVSLSVYYKGLSFRKSGIINITIPEVPIADSGFIYEFSDTNYYGYEAIKGFDDRDKNLIYHIKGNDTYYGLYHSFSSQWSVKDSSLNTYLFKREPVSFTYSNFNSLYNFDINGKTTNVNSDLSSLKILSITCPETRIAVLEDSIFKRSYQYRVFDDNNNQISVNYFPFGVVENRIISQHLKIYNNLAVSFRYYNYEVWMDKKYTGYRSDLNGFMVATFNANDFIKLNDSVYLVSGKNAIYGYSQSLKDKSDYSKGFNLPTNIFAKELSNFNIANIQKVSDELFISVGDSYQHPGYIIFNTNGEIVKQKIFTERFGTFNYAYITKDNGVLFSGWSYKTYPFKSPYYFKFHEPLAGTLDIKIPDTLGSASIVNHYCYPNPGYGDYNLVIDAKNSSYAEFSITDYTGINVISKMRLNFKQGKNEFKFSLSGLSIGLYIYELKLSDGILRGNVIRLRD